MKMLCKFKTPLLLILMSLVGCQTKEELSNPAGGDNQRDDLFVIKLDMPVKTINDGVSTEWVEGDKVNVFHAPTGTEDFICDGAFEYRSTGEFVGILGQNLGDNQSYDWYVAYPYDESMTSPKAMTINIPADQYQESDGSMAHLAGSLCPLAGKVSAVASNSSVAVMMNQLLTVMKIKVTNYEAEPCELKTVSFCHHTDPDGKSITFLSGNYNVDITGATPSYERLESAEVGVDIDNWEENTALTRSGKGSGSGRINLSLTDTKTLGLNESATVYVVCLPFTIANATFLNVGMNRTDGGISQRICKVVECKAGRINGIKQGSRLAPPFKNGITFYHGKKNSDGTYTIDNDGWWRCDLPEGYDLQGSFDFRTLFTTVNADADFELLPSVNQNVTVQYYYEDFAAYLGKEGSHQVYWNGDPDMNVNLYFPEEDKSGVFINSSAGYQVGSWPIFYREADTQADGPVIDTESDQYDSYQGLVMAGYQGWHGTPGDGCAHNPAEAWPHYANVAEQPFIFEPGVLRNNIDFWPDVSEYPNTYEAPKDFVLPGGSTPRLYSSYDESTVDLHFSWMKEYGIDGVFMQRFVSQLTNPAALIHSDKVLESAMKASNVHARAISIMYDMVGMEASTNADVILNDAVALKAKYNLDDRSKGQRYFLYHNGKPLIGLVSVGQAGVPYTINQAQAIVDGLQQLGFSIMLGVPAYWRSPGYGDCINDGAITTLIKDVDIIMPWLVGTYDYDGTVTTTPEGSFDDFWTKRMEDTGSFIKTKGDYSQASSYGVEYCPLVFPGFSDRNIHPDHQVYERKGGDFYWKQIYKHLNKGAKMLYVAMFDEIDEGTAIYKCLRKGEVPSNTYSSDYYVVYENGAYRRSDTAVSVSGSGNWCKKASELGVTFNGIEDDLDSDYYLWLTGQAAKVLRGEAELTESKPIR